MGHLRQVSRYLSRKPVRRIGRTLNEQIQDRVRSAITGEETVVVAHSLGTVVAYETLHSASARIPLLVTVGSPLALRTVVLPRVLPSPLQTPEAIGRWLDFWDREDFIAARPLARHDVEPNSRGVVPISNPTLSDGLWAHSAVKYLKQAQVAGPIVEALGS
jgi:pimeloyl-ACP methyl ester carboxylesterase